MQWVPSHVGVKGNECADEGAVRGSAQAFRDVLRDWEVRDIWQDLGLEGMSDGSDNHMSGGLELILIRHRAPIKRQVVTPVRACRSHLRCMFSKGAPRPPPGSWGGGRADFPAVPNIAEL